MQTNLASSFAGLVLRMEFGGAGASPRPTRGDWGGVWNSWGCGSFGALRLLRRTEKRERRVLLYGILRGMRQHGVEESVLVFGAMAAERTAAGVMADQGSALRRNSVLRMEFVRVSRVLPAAAGCSGTYIACPFWAGNADKSG